MIEWPWGEAIPAAYLRLSLFTATVVAIYFLGPKMWGLMVRYRTRNVASKEGGGKTSEQEVCPSNQDISRDKFELEDPRGTAEAIEGHLKEEWAKQHRRR